MSFKNSIAQCGNGHTIFWMEVLDNGEVRDKKAFPPHVVENLKMRPNLWFTQYRLKKAGDIDSLFDVKRMGEAEYEWVDRPMDTVMRYQGFEFDPDKLDEYGYASPQMVVSKISLGHCRMTMHVDAKHKLQSQMRAAGRGGERPSEAAVVICATAPDGHVFLVDYWAGDAGLEGLVARMHDLYCLWAPYTITWESVSAQFWLKEHIEKIEKYDAKYQHPRARTRFGVEGELPRMSARMVEAEKTNQTKEFIAQTVLSAWLNSGVFHLPSGTKGEKPKEQLLNVLNPKHEIDLVDCLGQGPAVWKPPPASNLADDMLRRRAFVNMSTQNRSGFVRGFGHPAGGSGRSGFKRPW